jgi:hypothetical protein
MATTDEIQRLAWMEQTFITIRSYDRGEPAVSYR